MQRGTGTLTSLTATGELSDRSGVTSDMGEGNSPGNSSQALNPNAWSCSPMSGCEVKTSEPQAWRSIGVRHKVIMHAMMRLLCHLIAFYAVAAATIKGAESTDLLSQGSPSSNFSHPFTNVMQGLQYSEKKGHEGMLSVVVAVMSNGFVITGFTAFGATAASSASPEHNTRISTTDYYSYCSYYSTSNTDSASNSNARVCYFVLCGGTTVTFSSCSNYDGYCSGDQYLRLVDSFGSVVAQNDDYCGLCSQFTYYNVLHALSLARLLWFVVMLRTSATDV